MEAVFLECTLFSITKFGDIIKFDLTFEVIVAFSVKIIFSLYTLEIKKSSFEYTS